MKTRSAIKRASQQARNGMQQLDALIALIQQWENRARSKFKSAEVQPNEASRRFVEHGATCYFNCAQELREALALKPDE
jgi:hypothetical protein